MPVFEQVRSLSEQRFFSIYEALSEKGFGPLEGEVAKLLKFRPQSVKKIPLEKRAKLAKGWIEQKHNGELCYELLGTYLMRTKPELITGFLDATDVPHKEGMIDNIGASQPAVEKIPEAIKALEAKFEPDDVTLYMAMCAEQWPGVPELAALWRQRSGLE